MAVVNVYKVHYHGEFSGKKLGPEFIKYVQAASSDENAIRAVLNSNNVLPAGTLRITSVANVGPATGGDVLA